MCHYTATRGFLSGVEVEVWACHGVDLVKVCLGNRACSMTEVSISLGEYPEKLVVGGRSILLDKNMGELFLSLVREAREQSRQNAEIALELSLLSTASG